jgi:hypothetical protein
LRRSPSPMSSVPTDGSPGAMLNGLCVSMRTATRHAHAARRLLSNACSYSHPGSPEAGDVVRLGFGSTACVAPKSCTEYCATNRATTMAKAPKHEPLILRFKADLKRGPVGDSVQKHITTGMPTELSEDDYFDLRRVVAAEFDLHPSAVVLVGSCRQGFSIAPKKRWNPAHPGSDLDIAIVSSESFDLYWDSVFAYSRSDRAWQRTRRYRRFVAMLFRGWIDPRGLPAIRRFEDAARWVKFFDGLMQTRRFGTRRIRARLYRSWSRLDAYQEIAVQKCVTTATR